MRQLSVNIVINFRHILSKIIKFAIFLVQTKNNKLIIYSEQIEVI